MFTLNHKDMFLYEASLWCNTAMYSAVANLTQLTHCLEVFII